MFVNKKPVGIIEAKRTEEGMRLKSSYIPGDCSVCISTIQRMYSILKGTELNESAEETYPNKYHAKEPPPVAYNVFTMETKITKNGNTIALGENVDKRERLTRRKFWETVDEDVAYSGRQLDRGIVNESTIRTIIRAMKYNLPHIFSNVIENCFSINTKTSVLFTAE